MKTDFQNMNAEEMYGIITATTLPEAIKGGEWLNEVSSQLQQKLEKEHQQASDPELLHSIIVG